MYSPYTYTIIVSYYDTVCNFVSYFANFTLGLLVKVNFVNYFTNFTLAYSPAFGSMWACEYFTNLIPTYKHGILYTDRDKRREWII